MNNTRRLSWLIGVALWIPLWFTAGAFIWWIFFVLK
jgi:hypothetical protein